MIERPCISAYNDRKILFGSMEKMLSIMRVKDHERRSLDLMRQRTSQIKLESIMEDKNESENERIRKELKNEILSSSYSSID